MLKISIVLVTTTAFAALLIAYPFSPHPAAQAGAATPKVAVAAIPEERPSTLLPQQPPAQVAAPSQTGTPPAKTTTGKILPTAPPVARLTSRPTDGPAAGASPPSAPGRMHVERAPYVRLARQAFHPAPGEPARPTLKHIVRRNDVPVYYPVSNKVVAVPTVARGQIPAASPADVAHYPSYTTRTPAFTPQGTSIVRRTYVRMSATPDHRAKRLRTVVLALDQPRP